MRKRGVFALLLVGILTITSLSCGQLAPGKVDLYSIERNVDGTGRVFLWAIAYGEEQLAMSLLSARTQAAVTQYCEGGKIISCFKDVRPQEWDSVASIPNYSYGSTVACQIHYQSHDPTLTLLIVLRLVKENGDWRVDSWRGLIPVVGGDIGALVDGTDTTNLFPPEE